MQKPWCKLHGLCIRKQEDKEKNGRILIHGIAGTSSLYQLVAPLWLMKSRVLQINQGDFYKYNLERLFHDFPTELGILPAGRSLAEEFQGKTPLIVFGAVLSCYRKQLHQHVIVSVQTPLIRLSQITVNTVNIKNMGLQIPWWMTYWNKTKSQACILQ